MVKFKENPHKVSVVNCTILLLALSVTCLIGGIFESDVGQVVTATLFLVSGAAMVLYSALQPVFVNRLMGTDPDY